MLQILKSVLLTLAVTLASAVSFAQTAPVPATPVISTNSFINFGDTDAVLKNMKAVINVVEDTLREMSTNTGMQSVGLQLLGFFFTLNLVWSIVKGFVTGRMLDHFLGEILPMGVGTVAAWMFIGAASGVGGLGESLKAFLDHIGGIVAPGVYNGGSVLGLVTDSVTSTLLVIVKLFKLNMSTSTAGFWDLATGGALLVVVSAILKVMTVLLVFVILMCALGAFIATVILSQVTVYIALMFLPLFVPFMIYSPLSGYFSAWLSFFVSSFLMKIIGAVIITFSNKVMVKMVDVANSLPDTAVAGNGLMIDIVIYAVLILMAFICYIMVSRIEPIAKALAGSAASGFKGFGKELQGTSMGNIGKPDVGQGGGKMGGNSSLNATSGLTAALPSAVKPISRAVGNMVSSVAGKKSFANDMKSQKEKDKLSGPHKPGQAIVTRDTSKMSAKAAQAYGAALGDAKAGQAASWNGKFQGNLPSTTPPK